MYPNYQKQDINPNNRRPSRLQLGTQDTDEWDFGLYLYDKPNEQDQEFIAVTFTICMQQKEYVKYILCRLSSIPGFEARIVDTSVRQINEKEAMIRIILSHCGGNIREHPAIKQASAFLQSEGSFKSRNAFRDKMETVKLREWSSESVGQDEKEEQKEESKQSSLQLGSQQEYIEVVFNVNDKEPENYANNILDRLGKIQYLEKRIVRTEVNKIDAYCARVKIILNHYPNQNNDEPIREALELIQSKFVQINERLSLLDLDIQKEEFEAEKSKYEAESRQNERSSLLKLGTQKGRFSLLALGIQKGNDENVRPSLVQFTENRSSRLSLGVQKGRLSLLELGVQKGRLSALTLGVQKGDNNQYRRLSSLQLSAELRKTFNDDANERPSLMQLGIQKGRLSLLNLGTQKGRLSLLNLGTQKGGQEQGEQRESLLQLGTQKEINDDQRLSVSELRPSLFGRLQEQYRFIVDNIIGMQNHKLIQRVTPRSSLLQLGIQKARRSLLEFGIQKGRLSLLNLGVQKERPSLLALGVQKGNYQYRGPNSLQLSAHNERPSLMQLGIQKGRESLLNLGTQKQEIENENNERPSLLELGIQKEIEDDEYVNERQTKRIENAQNERSSLLELGIQKERPSLLQLGTQKLEIAAKKAKNETETKKNERSSSLQLGIQKGRESLLDLGLQKEIKDNKNENEQKEESTNYEEENNDRTRSQLASQSNISVSNANMDQKQPLTLGRHDEFIAIAFNHFGVNERETKNYVNHLIDRLLKIENFEDRMIGKDVKFEGNQANIKIILKKQNKDDRLCNQDRTISKAWKLLESECKSIKFKQPNSSKQWRSTAVQSRRKEEEEKLRSEAENTAKDHAHFTMPEHDGVILLSFDARSSQSAFVYTQKLMNKLDKNEKFKSCIWEKGSNISNDGRRASVKYILHYSGSDVIHSGIKQGLDILKSEDNVIGIKLEKYEYVKQSEKKSEAAKDNNYLMTEQCIKA